MRDPGRDQRFVQIDMLGGVGGKDQEIRVSRKDRLQIRLFHAAEKRDIRAELHAAFLYGVAGRADQRAARKRPRLCKAAVERRYPLPARQGDGIAQRICKRNLLYRVGRRAFLLHGRAGLHGVRIGLRLCSSTACQQYSRKPCA